MSKITKINVGGVDYELGGSGSAQVIETTYAQLKELVDASGLTPGNRYRITDFVSIYNSQVKSANHPFDLIVTAYSANAFYPKAEAVKHEGDDYFANNDLSKWEIWYDFKNDTTKYAFANKDTGKGFIYRMIDENNNDVNYDFKNLLVTVKPNWFQSAFESEEGEAYFYTFSYSEGSTPSDLCNSSDFSVISPSGCYDNYIRINLRNSTPFLNGGGIVLGFTKGILSTNSRIYNNHIEGQAFIFQKATLSGHIYGNISYNTLQFTVLCSGMIISGNNAGVYGIIVGPLQWKDDTYNFELGDITNNLCLSGSITLKPSKTDLSFQSNVIRGEASLTQNVKILQCEFIGDFPFGAELGETDDISGKMIVGKGETVSIIDPSTFYS